MRCRWWGCYLAGGCLVVAGYLAVPAGALRDLTYLFAGLASVVGIAVGVRLHRPARPSAWYLMAAGESAWLIGDALYGTSGDGETGPPFPSLSDAVHLCAYPLIAVGLVVLIRARQRGLDGAGLIDSAVVTLGLGLLSWVFLAGPILADVDSPLHARIVALAYPAGDVVLLGLLVRLVTVPGARSTAFRLLIAAAGLLLVADTTYAVVIAVSAYERGAMELLWLASYVLWGAAALHPSMRTLSEPGVGRAAPFTPRRLAALTVAVLIAPCTLAAQLVLGATPTPWPVIVCSVALFLLVVTRMHAAIREITASNDQRDRLQDDLAHQAAHDPLTELANRARVLEVIEGALHRGQRAGSAVGLLFVDLDRFKAVNDEFGHRVGDDVLRTTAARLRSLVRSGDTVGRLGGDEFVVLVEPLNVPAELVELADRLIVALSAPMQAAGQEVTVGASVGVAINADGGTDAGQLLHHADIAAYRAKSSGRGRAEVFDDALRRELEERADLETAVRTGLAAGEFLLHYQPVVELRTGLVQGYEALVRWQRPGHGLLFPDAFIPTAELSVLICDIDRWVLVQATRQLAEWLGAGGDAVTELTMAVNISGRHLAGSSIVTDVARALRDAGVPARQLVLEITETVLVNEPTATSHLADLRGLGVSISIDDFGTGYTSIGQLQHLHVDVLKIDKSFINSSAAQTRALVTLMIDAGHAMGLQVVAEGIEHADQVGLLRQLACDSGQGYLFARPQPASSITYGHATWSDPGPAASHAVGPGHLAAPGAASDRT